MGIQSIDAGITKQTVNKNKTVPFEQANTENRIFTCETAAMTSSLYFD